MVDHWVTMVDMGIDKIDASAFSWQSAGLCNGAPSYIFFPEEASKEDFVPEIGYEDKTYKDYCKRCPVKYLCLEFALLHDLQGVWGGLTDRQRTMRFKKEEREAMREYSSEYSPLYGHS